MKSSAPTSARDYSFLGLGMLILAPFFPDVPYRRLNEGAFFLLAGNCSAVPAAQGRAGSEAGVGGLSIH